MKDALIFYQFDPSLVGCGCYTHEAWDKIDAALSSSPPKKSSEAGGQGPKAIALGLAPGYLQLDDNKKYFPDHSAVYISNLTGSRVHDSMVHGDGPSNLSSPPFFRFHGSPQAALLPDSFQSHNAAETQRHTNTKVTSLVSLCLGGL